MPWPRSGWRRLSHNRSLTSGAQPGSRNSACGSLRPCGIRRLIVSLAKKLSTALNETRLLILGAQVLFGFEFHGIFQDGFTDLPRTSRYLDCVSLLCMATAIGLLIAPSAQHRIVERGEETRRIHRVTSFFAGLALLPFGISLVIDVSIG